MNASDDGRDPDDGFAINAHVVGVGRDDLRRIRQGIAVARRLPRAASILGALRGHFLTVLTTDGVTAQAVLEMA